MVVDDGIIETGLTSWLAPMGVRHYGCHVGDIKDQSSKIRRKNDFNNIIFDHHLSTESVLRTALRSGSFRMGKYWNDDHRGESPLETHSTLYNTKWDRAWPIKMKKNILRLVYKPTLSKFENFGNLMFARKQKSESFGYRSSSFKVYCNHAK